MREGLRVVSREDLTKLFPNWQRPCTDQGYPCDDMPLYLKADADCFAFEAEDVIGYDCAACGGVVLGQPDFPQFGMQDCRIMCVRCEGVIFSEILHPDDTCTT